MRAALAAHAPLAEPALADRSQQAAVGAGGRFLAAAVEQEVEPGAGGAHGDVRAARHRASGEVVGDRDRPGPQQRVGAGSKTAGVGPIRG